MRGTKSLGPYMFVLFSPMVSIFLTDKRKLMSIEICFLFWHHGLPSSFYLLLLFNFNDIFFFDLNSLFIEVFNCIVVLQMFILKCKVRMTYLIN